MQNRFPSIIFLFVLISSLSFSQSSDNQDCPVIPRPVVYQVVSGNFLLTENEIQVNTTNLPDEIGAYFSSQLQNSFSIKTTLSKNQGDVLFRKIINVPQHSYSINIASTITITYSSDESCFYAVNTLLQLLQKNGEQYQFQKCFISDLPNFEWRGMQLDATSHFIKPEDVKRFIDLMALYKFNRLLWHLTDDQGWRIEIKQFPKLTEIGSCRDSSLISKTSEFPRKYEKKRVDGYYTQEQIKDIVSYASKRFISIVPEIEIMGHCRAALAAYPEYSCLEKPLTVACSWGTFEDIYCSKPETITFLKKVIDEIIPLFSSNYIHIGNIEVPKTRWLECPKCHQVMTDNKLTTEQELTTYFSNQIVDYINSKGKKVINWNTILPKSIVMSSNGVENELLAIKQRSSVIDSPSEYCDFNQSQNKDSNELKINDNYLPIEKVYEFNPLPSGITFEQASYILGGQGNIYTESISTLKELEFMAFPRMLALSQVLWCREQKPTFDNFRTILIQYQFPFMKRYTINYSNAILK